MSRGAMVDAARSALRDMAPELGAAAVEGVLNSRPLQLWFDSIERRRPRGLVALVRRLRGKDRGLTAEQRQQLERFLRQETERLRR